MKAIYTPFEGFLKAARVDNFSQICFINFRGFGNLLIWVLAVPDKRSRDHEVVVVRRKINLGTGNMEWGGNGEGLRKGRSVYE